MAKTVRKFSKFKYYEEDCRCEFCLHHTKKGCTHKPCCCRGERMDAIKNGRLKRKRGWNK